MNRTALAQKQPVRRRRRPITWQDIEHKKRSRDPETAEDTAGDPRRKSNPGVVLVPPWKMARWVGSGVFIGLLLVAIIVAIYYGTKSQRTSPPKIVGERLPETIQSAEPTSIAALGEKFGIQPAPFEGENATVQVGGEIENLCVGGGGRFIVLKLLKQHELKIFDVNQAQIVKAIPVATATKFAACGRKLVISNPQRRTLERWDLLKQQRNLDVGLPENEEVKELVMGSASDGPILEIWGDRSALMVPVNHLRFLDLETLAETPIRNLPPIGPEQRRLPGFGGWQSIHALGKSKPNFE